MPPETYHPMWELLMRHGVEQSHARALAVRTLRNWELDDVESVLRKAKLPSPDFAYFRSDLVKPTRLPADVENRNVFQKWWPSLWDVAPRWVSAPRHLVEQSAKEGLALCVNVKGEWSLRSDGYVALSHVWIEGLQRYEEHGGLEKTKVVKVFELLARAGLEYGWIWTDVLAIPGSGKPTTLEDELLITDLINAMPDIYGRADAILVIDALLLQLESNDLLDVAVALSCGKWATRVWTYQEIKLANRAVIVTASGGVSFAEMIEHLERLEPLDGPRYRSLYIWAAIMGKSDRFRLTIRDLVTACGERSSGFDIDYARAFFPILGLKWTTGMTREEGMQKIYRSRPRDTSVIAAFAGSPRMKLDPGWAPSYLQGLEGVGHSGLRWESRGIRGEWYVLRITKLIDTTRPRFGKIGFNIEVDCNITPRVQCVCAPNEYPEVIEAVKQMTQEGQGWILSVTSFETYDPQWARSVLIAKKAETMPEHGVEMAVYCSATIGTAGAHRDERVSLLIRHGNPNVDLDLPNTVEYQWHCDEDLSWQENDTPLQAAVRQGDLMEVRHLVDTGVSIDDFDHRGYSPLHIAAGIGYTDMLDFLTKKTSNIETPSKGVIKDTPLIFAARRGQAESIRVLLNNGASIEGKNEDNCTALMCAAYECHTEAVAMLLEMGADPNAGGFSSPPLLLASGRNGKGIETMKLLVQHGADVDPTFDPLGWTPLLKAADMGNDGEVEFLLSKGAKVSVRDHRKRTPLAHAIYHARARSVRMLLDAGSDREAVFDEQLRPVHLATECGNYEIMQMILESGTPIDVNVRMSEKFQQRTPLHLAVLRMEATVVKLLLKHGADVNAQDANGLAPMDFAVARNSSGIQAILSSAGGLRCGRFGFALSELDQRITL